MSSPDKTKELLEQILAGLYQKQSNNTSATSTGKNTGSFLIASDNQFLGELTNKLDQNSILNKYGTYGSKYSPTSIFNKYSPYGSPYGAFSIRNPYCAQPPKLFVKGKFFKHITANRYVNNAISPEAFIYNLENNLASLLKGRLIESKSEVLKLRGDSYIEASNGTFLGKINPNQFDVESIFNQFGTYGNKFSTTSIFNEFSAFGGQFSQLSPYNSYSRTPPKVFVKGKFHAYLTKNNFISPRIDPDTLLEWAKANISNY